MHLPLLCAFGTLVFGIGPSLVVARSASPTSSCGNIPTPSPTPGPQFHCNSQGTASSASSYVISSFPSGTGDNQACYQSCLGDASCISFSYDVNDKSCVTYSNTVNSLGFTKSASSRVFYSNLKGCYLLATCGPAPKEWMPNGGFEDAVRDSRGVYHASNWHPDDTNSIQKVDGYGHSSFSVKMVNVSTLIYSFPETLVEGNYYEFSYYYHIAQGNKVKDTYIQYKFEQGQYVGGINLYHGPKGYTRANTTFRYTDDPDQTALVLFMVGIDNQYTDSQEVVVFDSFSVVDVPAPPA